MTTTREALASCRLRAAGTRRTRDLYARYYSGGGLTIDEGREYRLLVLEHCDELDRLRAENERLKADRDEMQKELSEHREARELVVQYLKQQEERELADLEPEDLPETQLIDICNSLRELADSAYDQGRYDQQMADGPSALDFENQQLKRRLDVAIAAMGPSGVPPLPEEW